MIKTATSIIGIAVLAVTVAAAHAQSADNYPTRTIRFIVPFPPGGNTDVVVRTIDPCLAKPDDFARFIEVDRARTAKAVKASNIRLD